MKHALFVLHSNRPARPTPTRPARIVSRRVLTAGRQGELATYAVEAVCDDLQVRAFVERDGVLRRKG
jgi:hypothetical protein